MTTLLKDSNTCLDFFMSNLFQMTDRAKLSKELNGIINDINFARSLRVIGSPPSAEILELEARKNEIQRLLEIEMGTKGRKATEKDRLPINDINIREEFVKKSRESIAAMRKKKQQEELEKKRLKTPKEIINALQAQQKEIEERKAEQLSELPDLIATLPTQTMPNFFTGKTPMGEEEEEEDVMDGGTHIFYTL
jgi:hypothetical protein